MCRNTTKTSKWLLQNVVSLQRLTNSFTQHDPNSLQHQWTTSDNHISSQSNPRHSPGKTFGYPARLPQRSCVVRRR